MGDQCPDLVKWIENMRQQHTAKYMSFDSILGKIGQDGADTILGCVFIGEYFTIGSGAMGGFLAEGEFHFCGYPPDHAGEK